MVKHTQTIHRQIADGLFECGWPFCGVKVHRKNMIANIQQNKPNSYITARKILSQKYPHDEINFWINILVENGNDWNHILAFIIEKCYRRIETNDQSNTKNTVKLLGYQSLGQK